MRALFRARSLPFVEVMDQINPALRQRLKGHGIEIGAQSLADLPQKGRSRLLHVKYNGCGWAGFRTSRA